MKQSLPTHFDSTYYDMDDLSDEEKIDIHKSEIENPLLHPDDKKYHVEAIAYYKERMGMKLFCSKCKKPLDTKGSVTREYIARNPKENEDSYLAGHYDQSGNFEPDGNSSYPVVNHDLVDGSDTCTACGEGVG